MKTLEHLKAVRELLSDESHWTQGEAARSEDGRAVSPQEKEACSWCLIGAAIKVAEEGSDAHQILRALKEAGSIKYVHHFNDSHSHAEVLQLLDKAINAHETASTGG